MLKKLLPFALLALLTSCAGVDYSHLAGAGLNLAKGASVSDSDLQAMSMRMRAQEDARATVAPQNSEYTQRLDRVMARETSVHGIPLNYKVYMTSEVNANATPDGSVRVYSGLMDKMNDDELRFVLGHEIGHVAHGHAQKAMRMAYAAEAARQAAGAINPTLATLTDSQLGNLATSFVNAQYSQSQETDADKYSMDFLKRNHYNTMAAGTALRKLADGGASGLGFLSSHPDPLKRARLMDQLARDGSSSTTAAQ